MGKLLERLQRWEKVTGIPATKTGWVLFQTQYPEFKDREYPNFRRPEGIETILVEFHLYQMRLSGFQVGDLVQWKSGICGAPARDTIGTVSQPWWNMKSGEIPVDSQQGTGAWVWHPSNLIKVKTPAEVA